ncbi:MAG: OmpA family protein [Persicimonas sp.]
MDRDVYKLFACVVAAGLLLGGLFGCGTGSKLRAQGEEVQERTKSIHDRAYVCAPRQLAEAESHADFGLYELDQGDFFRARRHIYRAEEYAREADKLSDYDECRDEDVDMDVEQEPTVEVDEAEEGPDDRDGDDIVDEEDECPDEPEDFDGFEDEDGCPDTDNDEDGIPDVEDECPNVAEDDDGFQDDDGCPDFDNDLDGIRDTNDQCPDEAEDYDGYEDEDGCPDRDNDDDGIVDREDECPDEAEDYDGDEDEDGCPEERERVTVEKDEIKLEEKVHFETDKSEILPESYPLLNEVAEVLENNPDIKIRIEGHTDSRGSQEYNQELSEERAGSIVDYLVDRDIDRSRLESKGYGETKPIEDNATKAGRAANRRVEMHITDR